MTYALSLLQVALAAAAPFKLAATNLSVTGVEAQRAPFYTEHFASRLTEAGVRVITQKEIAALLGAERQRELLGCSDAQGSCMAELASALGTDGVLLGDVAHLEDGTYQATLKVVWARDGRPLTSFTGRAFSETALLDVLSRAAAQMGHDLANPDWATLTAAPATHSFEPRHPLQQWSWVPLVFSAAGLGIGIWAFASTGSIATRLETGQFATRADAQAVASEGKTLQTLGVAMFAVAAATTVAAVVMYVAGSQRLRAQLAFAPGATGLFIAGAWP